ncbi:MAG TPA: DUF3551 domain-containing protein [Bradyrhizobium sp.]|nr:DUF3551 domain-containing protein [Bradyrhizobium sp.]
MRKLILIACGLLGILAASTSLATPVNAAANQWCYVKKGITRCIYATEHQCRASRSGRGGSCFRRQAAR